MTLFQNIKYFSVVTLMVLTALSYHPTFSNLVIEVNGTNPLSKYILLVASVCVVLHLNFKPFKYDNTIKKISVCFLAILIIGLFLAFSGIDDSYLDDAKNIGMSIAFLLIGYNAKMDFKHSLFLILIYSLVVGYCTYMQIIQNFGGFVINDLYIQYGKNTLGVMTASACIANVAFSFFTDSKYIRDILWGAAAILLFFTITIRARAAFLTTFAIIGYLFFKNYQHSSVKSKCIYIIVSISIVIILGVFSNAFNSIFDYIVRSFTQNQGDDLTSGRMSRNIFALNLIADSPFWGNMVLHRKYDWIHNYFLRVLSSYGIIGAIPLVYMYIFIFARSIKSIWQNKINLSTVGCIVMLVPFVISLEEPTFPYAPGTGTILPFILWGISLNILAHKS